MSEKNNHNDILQIMNASSQYIGKNAQLTIQIAYNSNSNYTK